jgi:hypothetical protein
VAFSNAMDAVTELERCIAVIAMSAARTAVRVGNPDNIPPLPPPIAPTRGSPGQHLALALGLTDDEFELLWSVIARASEPSIAANARAVFGADARGGASLAEHIAWRELSGDRSRNLLAVLDPRHPLRKRGLLLPVGPEPYDVLTPWTTSYRVIQYLRGEDTLDPDLAPIGGMVMTGAALHSAEQRTILDTLREWLTGIMPATVIVEGPVASGRRTVVALAAHPRRTIAVDFARVSPRRAESVLAALRRETLLLDAIPVLANLDELWARAEGEIRDMLVNLLDDFDGALAITTSSGGLELRAERRMTLRARWPLPDAATRRLL